MLCDLLVIHNVPGDDTVYESTLVYWGLLKRNKCFSFSLSVFEEQNTLLLNFFFLLREKESEGLGENFCHHSTLSHQSTMSLGYAEKLSYIEDVGNVGMVEYFDPSHVLREKVGPLSPFSF